MAKPHYRRTAGGDMLPAIRFADGFQNIVGSLGTARDKSSGNSYTDETIDPVELRNAYKSSSFAKAVVDLPAEDMCREWREWQATADQISDIEAVEKALGLQKKMLDATKLARLYGGAAIHIGTGEADLSKPLNPERIGRGGIKYLTVLSRFEVISGILQDDPRLPGYGMPVDYQMTSAKGGIVRIHPSRLVLVRGDDVLGQTFNGYNDGWGDSVLQSTIQKIGYLDATIANIASLVFEAKIDVVNIKNFTESLRTGGTAYETLMLKRFALAATAKGNNGTLLLDESETYTQKSANFSTLPDILDRMMQIVASAARVPMTRFFGMAPGGLNATGEADERIYFDRIKQEQTLEMEPSMSVLDECLIRSALGNRPPEIHFNWRSLFQMSDKEKAEIADKLATAAGKMNDIGLPIELITNALVNALTENGTFPGMEADYNELFAGEGEDDLPLVEGDGVAIPEE